MPKKEVTVPSQWTSVEGELSDTVTVTLVTMLTEFSGTIQISCILSFWHEPLKCLEVTVPGITKVNHHSGYLLPPGGDQKNPVTNHVS